MTPLWFKWWIGSVDDAKLRLVAAKSSTKTGEVIAVWASILERCARSDERGQCGDIDAEEIGCQLSFDSNTVTAIIDAMRSRGLLDGNKVVSWDKRQETSVDRTNSERQRRHRERQASESNGSVTVVTALRNGVTDDEPLRNGVTALRNTDKMGIDGKRKEEKTTYSREFESFWEIYPRPVEKSRAFKVWNARIKDGADPKDLVNAARCYAQHCTDKRTEAQYMKHPATFLNPDWVEWLNKKTDEQIAEERKQAERAAMSPEDRKRAEQLDGFVW